MIRTGAIFAVVGLLSLSPFGSSLVHPASHHLARAYLYDWSGLPVGRVEFEDMGGTVYLRVILERMRPGWHGVNIYGVGSCIPPDFNTAGGHYNPSSTAHPNHAGDLPLVYVISDGTADMLFKTDRFALADLFDADGSSVVIHGAADNYANIPGRYKSSSVGSPGGGPDSTSLASGDAGPRVACGVVIR